jgi:hypothetical protein
MDDIGIHKLRRNNSLQRAWKEQAGEKGNEGASKSLAAAYAVLARLYSEVHEHMRVLGRTPEEAIAMLHGKKANTDAL